MTDYKIENGDVKKDSAGRYIKITGRDAEFQRALICITARLGKFIYNRELGSRAGEIETGGAESARRLELVLNEALAKYEKTSVRVTEYGERLVVKITIDGESRIEEVRLNGNV